ncbi:MAG: hypothetical protein Fur0044_23150 [Anaerolineae bacterium]|nr:hypothetical protein [Anaerolineales bacterium]MCQ3972607.1 hypothetical protein [Anaerolineae bacterium]
MSTLKRKQALLWGLAIVLVALSIIEALPGIGKRNFEITPREGGRAVTSGLEIISGNIRPAIFGPVQEPALLAGASRKAARTEVSV